MTKQYRYLQLQTPPCTFFISSQIKISANASFSYCHCKHSIKSGQQMKFQETKILDETLGYMDRQDKEAIGIQLHLDNIDGEEGFKFSKAWNSSTRLLRHHNTLRMGKSKEHKHVL
jgi:hypothetical protein